MNLTKRIYLILIFLVLLDVVLALVGFFFPDFWFAIFHGVDSNDPQGFLRRCAADWTAFALIQFIVLIKWRKNPVWLVMVSGVRLSDIFTDWAYLWFCSDITLFGKLALFSAGPGNLFFGWYLFHIYKKIKSGQIQTE